MQPCQMSGEGESNLATSLAKMSNEGGDNPRDGSKHTNNAWNVRFRMVNLGTRRRTTRPRAVLTIPRQPLVENTRLGVPKTRSQPTMGRVIRLFCSQFQGVQDPARGGALLAVRFRTVVAAAADAAAALARPVGPEHPQFSGGEDVTTCQCGSGEMRPRCGAIGTVPHGKQTSTRPYYFVRRCQSVASLREVDIVYHNS